MKSMIMYAAAYGQLHRGGFISVGNGPSDCLQAFDLLTGRLWTKGFFSSFFFVIL